MSTAHTVHLAPQRRHDPDLRLSPRFAMLSVEDGGDIPAGNDCGWMRLLDAGSAVLVLAPMATSNPRQLLQG